MSSHQKDKPAATPAASDPLEKLSPAGQADEESRQMAEFIEDLPLADLSLPEEELLRRYKERLARKAYGIPEPDEFAIVLQNVKQKQEQQKQQQKQINRAVKLALQKQQRETKAKRSVFSHSTDYGTVTIHREKLLLTPRQAKVVELLHEAYEAGTPELSHAFILKELGTPRSRLRDSFRNRGLWNTLFISSRGKIHLKITP